MGDDPRVVRTRAAVVAATREMLTSCGFRGVTIEGVAQRSGVAKTTIYRHWPERNDLLLDAFAFGKQPAVVPCTDDLRADLLVALQTLGAALAHSAWSAVLPALVEASEADDEFRQVFRSLVDVYRAPTKRRLRLAVRRGELPPGTVVEHVMSALAGPLFYRRLVTHQPVDDPRLLTMLVDRVVGSAAPQPAAGRSTIRRSTRKLPTAVSSSNRPDAIAGT
jgi:AcrR family transcriptional regulator